MRSTSGHILRFEGFALDLAAAELRRGVDLVAMEPQAFDLLALLAQNPDRVITRDEIIEKVWGGRIVSDSAIASRINAVRKAVDDDGTTQRLVKTIHGRGFRFTEVPKADDETHSAVAENSLRKSSIAVLPFVAMSDDTELAYFADGLAEDIIDGLSRFHELSVIARNSSFSFRDSKTPTRRIAERLGVKYMLEGSVRQMGQKIRVSVQLVDAEADRAIWSERYDGDLNDIFTVQDAITAKAVAAVAPQTQYAEMSSAFRKESTNLTDWERTMRARWHMDKQSRDDTDMALAILANVQESAPDLALAYSTEAVCRAHRMLNAWCSDTLEEISAAGKAAARAASLDAYDATANAIMGLSAMFHWRFAECHDLLDEAIAKNPNLAIAYGFRATAAGCQGDLERTLDAFDTAVRLSPEDSTRPLWHSGKGIALFLAGLYEETLENADRTMRIHNEYGPALRQRAAALVMLDRMDEAKIAMDHLLAAMPSLNAARLAKMVPIERDDHRKFWLDALRAAGLPD